MTSSVATPVPNCGGEHPIYGLYIAGSTINNSYKMILKICYQYALQCQHMKTISTIEHSLVNTHNSRINLKFEVHLEPTTGSTTEIGKEYFVSFLKLKVEEHKQETFYLIKVQMEKLLISLNILIPTCVMLLLQNLIPL